MPGSAVIEEIRGFILKHFPLARSRELGGDASLLETGILDSLGVLELVTHLEREFDITISDEDLVPEHFHSIAAIAAFVRSKDGSCPG